MELGRNKCCQSSVWLTLIGGVIVASTWYHLERGLHTARAWGYSDDGSATLCQPDTWSQPCSISLRALAMSTDRDCTPHSGLSQLFFVLPEKFIILFLTLAPTALREIKELLALDSPFQESPYQCTRTVVELVHGRFGAMSTLVGLHFFSGKPDNIIVLSFTGKLDGVSLFVLTLVATVHASTQTTLVYFCSPQSKIGE